MKRKFSCETVNVVEVGLGRNSSQRVAGRNGREENGEEKRLLQGNNNKSRNHFGQLQGSLPKSFLKKIDSEAAETIITPLWLGGGNHKKKQEFVKLRNDDFCLPNVPGGKKNRFFSFVKRFV